MEQNIDKMFSCKWLTEEQFNDYDTDKIKDFENSIEFKDHF